jgi:hypothetical protein
MEKVFRKHDREYLEYNMEKTSSTSKKWRMVVIQEECTRWTRKIKWSKTKDAVSNGGLGRG